MEKDDREPPAARRCRTNMDQHKREMRKLKREVKKAGNRKRRRALQRDLQDNPGEAAPTDADVNFGGDSSAGLNGMDRDATRRRGEPE
jgi:hypothetical protein